MIQACEAYLKVIKFINDNELDEYYEECGCEEFIDTLCKDCRAKEEATEIQTCVSCCARRIEKCESCGEKIRCLSVIFQQLDKLKANRDLPSKDEVEKAARFCEIVNLGTRCLRVNNDFIRSLHDDIGGQNSQWLVLDEFYEIVYNGRTKDFYKD